MWASTGTKVSLMKDETSSSANDSASSRAQATHAGAALKSSNNGFFSVLAFASAASISLSQLTDIPFTSVKMFRPIVVHAEVIGNRLGIIYLLSLKGHDIVYTEKCHDIVYNKYEIELRCGTRLQIAHSTSEPRSGSDRVNLWWRPRIVFTKTYAQGESLP